MKKIITAVGIAGAICFVAACKKEEAKPALAKTAAPQATLYVLMDSKPCSTPQPEYSSATVDIRGIKVFSDEHGWLELTPVPGAWDVVSLQTAPVPVAEITENTTVNAGTITKITLTFGTNNKLVVNDASVDCYKIGVKEVTLDINAAVVADALNEIVLSIDVCGNISVETKYPDDPCYTLNPVMAYVGIAQR